MSDDLNNADVRALVAALHGVRQDLADIKAQNASNAKLAGFQDRAHTNAIDKLTARLDRLVDRVERGMKLNREVGHEIAQGVVAVVKEETGKHRLPAPIDEAEVTQRFLRRWFFSQAVPWLVARGVFFKVFAVLTALAGAAWALLSRIAHKF